MSKVIITVVRQSKTHIFAGLTFLNHKTFILQYGQTPFSNTETSIICRLHGLFKYLF